ncbi:MAG TPA: response regulator transcription factor [Thermoanaerobaculia bacterium]|nr:response regulator transcription factor [Thermoanaerobaculia bacterium]HQN07174.1 response regulator transcription factor [Thermoanaerobaculia bacterium]HQP87368.1 response regulator transcription factor [Thermoanaerobaculia bacterium]
MSDHAPRVLVVEDDPETREFVARALGEDGLDVKTASRAETARKLVREGEFDLVILDVGLPGPSGLDLCAELRREESAVPILMLTARTDVASRVEGLEAGADDYLGKPFALAELRARVRALLRRGARPGPSGSVLEHGGVRVDLRRRRAFLREEELPLTRRELDLLARLVRAGGVVVAREALLEDVWGADTPEAAASLEVIVSRLRRKLRQGGGGSLLRNVRGVGYALDTEGA